MHLSTWFFAGTFMLLFLVPYVSVKIMQIEGSGILAVFYIVVFGAIFLHFLDPKMPLIWTFSNHIAAVAFEDRHGKGSLSLKRLI